MRICWLLLALLVQRVFAATLASDGSRADVQAKIDSASDGDTVTIPAGTFEWTTAVSVSGKAIHISGAGAERVLARSTSSVAVGTGTKTFTLITETVAAIEALKSEITGGTTLRIMRAGGEIDISRIGEGGVTNGGLTGNLPWMEGTVTSLVGSTLTMNITSTNYSGTHDVWIVTRRPQTIVTVNNAENTSLLSLTESTVSNVRLSGVHFAYHASAAASVTALQLLPTTGGKPILVHDCSFTPRFWTAAIVVRASTNRGVIWNCTFNFTPASAGNQVAVYNDPNTFASTSWSTVSTMGAADTNGTANFYIEACDFHFNNDAVDGSDNARIVIRNSLFNNSGMSFHGADTGVLGIRHYEIYDNEFVFNNPSGDNSTYAVDGWLIPRGGTGVFTRNETDDVNSFLWGNKYEIKFQAQPLTRGDGTNAGWGSNNDTAITDISVANPTVITSTTHGMVTGDYVRISGSNSTPTVNGYHQITKINDNSYTVAVNVTVSGNTGKSNRVDYPHPRQVGLGYVTGTGVSGTGSSTDAHGYVGDSEPFYAWANTGFGTGDIGADDVDQGGATDPDLASDYIKSGREYYADGTAKPGWTSYTYPHPLRGATGTATITGTLTVTGTITLE